MISIAGKNRKKLYQKTNESILMICPIFGKRIYAVIINKYVVLIMEQMISTVHFTKISKRFSLQEGKKPNKSMLDDLYYFWKQ